jgi:hypothetical protein
MVEKLLKFAVFSAVLSFNLRISSAESKDQSIARVYVGETDRQVHLVRRGGKEITIPKERDQVSASSPRIAEDEQTAGWLIDYENCCTSYPIPLTLVIYRAGRIVRLRPGLMISAWRFLERGKKVAVSSGTVHGMTFQHLSLYDSRTGHLLKEWDGDFDEAAPDWAKGLVR